MATTTSTQLALTSLLPKTFPPPPKLISTADLLLSLSRQRLPNLKPDEEITRAHACAELACKRLRVTLRLPNIKSGNGAPCRPAAYKKLLGFLEERLADVDVLGTPKKNRTGQNGTPSTRQSAGRSTGRKRNADDIRDEVETPTKKRRTGGGDLHTPTKSSSKKNSFIGRIESSTSKKTRGSEAPSYVLPTIRCLCKAFDTTQMIAHVYTGVCVLSAYAAQDSPTEPQEEQCKESVLGLTIAVYLLALTRMQKGPMTTEIYDAVSNASIELLDLRNAEGAVQADIEQWIAHINDGGWINEGNGKEWWSSVPEDVLLPLEAEAVQAAGQGEGRVEEDESERTPRPGRRKRTSLDLRVSRREELQRQLDENDPEDVLLPGLGTMMNDAVDYFSEERKAEYELWKADILRQIDAIEKAGGTKKGRAVLVAA